MRRMIGLLFPAFSVAASHAQEVRVRDLEHRSPGYGEVEFVLTVESDRALVECVASKNGVPISRGSASTTARIAKVTMRVPQKKGVLTLNCS
jgi:hypothetical protein